MTVRERLDVRRGVPFRRAWRLRNRQTGEWVPLGGYTARLTVRRYTDDPTPLLRATAGDGSGIVEVDETDGRVTLTLPADVTRPWDWQRGVYDLDLGPAGSALGTLRTGEIIVSSEVGR